MACAIYRRKLLKVDEAGIRLLTCSLLTIYIWGDSDAISMLAGFRRHLVGKTLINVFHCDIAEIRFVGKLVIIQTCLKPTDRVLFK